MRHQEVQQLAVLCNGLRLFISFSAALVMVGHAYSQTHPHYRLVDSRFPAEDAFPTVWVDDYRVLFTGVELGKRATKPDPRRYYRGLKNAAFLWDTRENKVTKFKDVPLSSFCSTGTYISYGIPEQHGNKEVIVVYGGKFGEEKKLGLRSDLPFFNPISCRYHTKSWLPPEANGQLVAFLLEEHGYIDFGPDDPSKRAKQISSASPTLRSLDGRKAVSLDIERRYRMNSWLRFSYLPFLKEYFTQGDTTNMREIVPAFYVSTAGVVRKIDVPQGAWKGPMYYAVSTGLFISTWNRRDKDFPNAFGGYLFANNNNKVVKVVTGALRRVSVSPDGCKVAFIYASSPDAIADGYRAWKEGNPGNTIRAIDFCEGEKK